MRGLGELTELRGPAVILSYRPMLVAIVSQNSFVLVLRGIAQLSRDDMLPKMVSHDMPV